MKFSLESLGLVGDDFCKHGYKPESACEECIDEKPMLFAFITKSGRKLYTEQFIGSAWQVYVRPVLITFEEYEDDKEIAGHCDAVLPWEVD